MDASRGATVSSASSFNKLAGMESGPHALLGLIFCSRFLTPSSEISKSGIGG